jgi:D-serine dehydratase
VLEQDRAISVKELGLGSESETDGLAVGQASAACLRRLDGS